MLPGFRYPPRLPRGNIGTLIQRDPKIRTPKLLEGYISGYRRVHEFISQWRRNSDKGSEAA